MINSNDLTYKPLYYAYDDGGKEYIVTYGNSVTIANEFVAHWICEKLNLPTAKTHLVSENGIIPSDYALAIECLEGLRRIKVPTMSQNLQDELIGHLTVGYLLGSLDTMRFYTDNEHIYTFGYNKAFHFPHICDQNSNETKTIIKDNMKSYKQFLQTIDFDISTIANEWGIPELYFKEKMKYFAQRISGISSIDTNEMKKQLANLYSINLPQMYIKCISNLKAHISIFDT